MKVSSQDFCSRKTGLRSEIHKCGQGKMDNIWASEQQQTAGTSLSSESVWSSPMRGTATSRSHRTRQHASGRTPVSDSVWAKMCRRGALRAKLRALSHWEMENRRENLVWIKMEQGSVKQMRLIWSSGDDRMKTSTVGLNNRRELCREDDAFKTKTTCLSLRLESTHLMSAWWREHEAPFRSKPQFITWKHLLVILITMIFGYLHGDKLFRDVE